VTRPHLLVFMTDDHGAWAMPRHGEGPARHLHAPTAVQAPALTRRAIFEALHARRCYATTGARIVADFTANGRPMGSEIAQSPGEPRVFEIMIRATAPLDRVQLISCGTVLAEMPVEPDTLDFNATWEDKRPGRPLRDCYYYIRARQADGHCAWLSPIWFDLADD